MAETTYTYSISVDFPNQTVDAGRLHSEIQSSAILTALDGVSTKGGDCDVLFKDALSTGDSTVLDGLVAVHDGVPLPDPTTVDGKPIVHLDAPEEDDGKPRFVMTPGPSGYRTFFTGRGDNPSPTPPDSGRGTGPEIGLDIPAADSFPKDYFVEWSYSEVTFVHDGYVGWRNPAHFSRKDYFSLSVNGDATVTVVNGTNTGNCNLVDVGGYNVVVPAAGNGTHDVDLAAACPVPTGKAKNGYWDVDKETGVITVSATPGSSKWILLDVPFQSFFLRCIPMVDWTGRFEIDTYMADWISPKWTWRLDVHKEVAPAADAEVAGWMYPFREKTN